MKPDLKRCHKDVLVRFLEGIFWGPEERRRLARLVWEHKLETINGEIKVEFQKREKLAPGDKLASLLKVEAMQRRFQAILENEPTEED